MDSAQIRIALEHWHILNLPLASSLRASGADCKYYPQSRHLLAWDIARAIDMLPPTNMVAAWQVIDGEYVPARRLEATCSLIAELLNVGGGYAG